MRILCCFTHISVFLSSCNSLPFHDNRLILICTYLYSILCLFALWWTLSLLKVKFIFILFTEPNICYTCLIAQKLGIFWAFQRQETVSFGCICPIRSLFVLHVQSFKASWLPHPLSAFTCVSLNKLWRAKDWIHLFGNPGIVELIGGGGQRVRLIERVWCNIAVWNWWLGPAWRGAHPESAGQCSKEDIRWGNLEITIHAQGDACYEAFVKKIKV